MARRRFRAPDFSFELAAQNAGAFLICGIDEAGRGPLAGPVVAAAVILDPRNIPRGLNDSKKLEGDQRRRLFAEIMAMARVGVGIGDRRDRRDQHSRHDPVGDGMRRFCNLGAAPHFALVDGNRAPSFHARCKPLSPVTRASLSIAAASIIAKVTRDRMMVALHEKFPGYGCARHKGYGTAFHHAALKNLAPASTTAEALPPSPQLAGDVQPQYPEFDLRGLRKDS